MARPTTVAEYIRAAPREAQRNLREIRAILRKAAPKATEALKWGSPVFEGKRILPRALIRKIALHRGKELREKDARWM